MIAAYGPMRAMREKLRAAHRRGLIACVDLGSSKTVVAILRLDAQRLARAEAEGRAHDVFAAMRVAGLGVHMSRGMRGGEVVDLDEAARGLRHALESAEKMAGERVDHAIALCPAARARSFDASGEAALEGVEVDPRDIARAVHDARAPLPEEMELLHAQPVAYMIDDGAPLEEPEGMAGEMLAAHLHVLAAPRSGLRNLAACLRRADLDLCGVVAAPYAAGLAALVEDERKLGAACVDLGAGSTGLSIFLQGRMIHAGGLRIGGDHITRDIAAGLAMPEAAAERIKILHGGAVATGVDDRDMIEAPSLDERHAAERRRISRAALIGVIRPRLEEILELSRDRLRAAGFEQLPSRRVALTGGAAQLPGLEETARRVFGRRVRIARPLRIAGLPQPASNPAFSALVGLCAHAARPAPELWDHDIPLAPNGRGRIKRTLRWFKQNW